MLAQIRLRLVLSDSPCAISPDGGVIFTAGDQAAAWDAATGKLIKNFGAPNSNVTAVELNAEGTLLASATAGDNPAIQLWNAFTGEQLHALAGISRPTAAITFSRNGQFLLSRSDDGQITLWDPASGARLRSLPDSVYQGKPAFSPDAKRIVALSNRGTPQISFCEPTTGIELVTSPTQANALAFSPDGTRIILMNGNNTRIWDNKMPPAQ
jgi:WD40 repeat protein